MFGKNPIRPPEKGDGSVLDVQRIFCTIQGEGPYAGWPAVFVRLGGCNLACIFCDTEFESFATQKTEDIIARVKTLAGDVCKLVVITGGEPLRQPVGLLCEQLLSLGFTVQIETNGTLYRDLPADVDIVCSPKNTGQGYYPLRADLLARVQALKFLISANRLDYADVPDVGQNNSTLVYIQPMDEYDEQKNAANLVRTVALAQRYGYRLSLQLHKMIGVE